jgi:hypothetical protein
MLDCAVCAAEAAGVVLLKNYDAVTGVERKADGTFVTDVDKQCSRQIAAALRAQFPSIVRASTATTCTLPVSLLGPSAVHAKAERRVRWWCSVGMLPQPILDEETPECGGRHTSEFCWVRLSNHPPSRTSIFGLQSRVGKVSLCR